MTALGWLMLSERKGALMGYHQEVVGVAQKVL